MQKTTTTQLTRALKVLPRAQLIAFLTAKHEGNILALKLIQESLADGETLEESFAPADTTAPVAPLVPELKVKRSEHGVYLITVGYFGDGVGDGGTYRVAFTPTGELEKIEPEEFWMC
ncbi:MAG TPA: hypothetical protein PLE71_17795 [Flavobacteriales bacterium]|nr:hypothetical protein [Flavobacteriales bacterium]